ncbi:MAG TPA: polyprenyl synthetase family protein [Acidimicrobiia bacterium]|nr:polyprenyl synthetase family protein [Acidimicrobiia bacterium]
MDELHDLIPLEGVWADLDRIEERLLEAVVSGDDYLTKIAQHLLLAGGKRFRPLLSLLSAQFGPADDRRRIEAAVAVELIHVGSLYHDDVIDHAETRRGAPSVNANWSNTVAILAGDFLMARASEVAATHLSLESVRLLAATYAELVEGQTRELQLVDSLGHPVAAYETVIGGKTASLIRTSARLGAIAGDADPAVVEALSTWAWELGMVFQIADDALDLVADEATIGKPAGSDIREGTFTRAVLEAAEGPDGARIRALLDRPRPFPNASVEEVIDLVRGGGYVDRTLEAAMGRVEVARQALEVLPAGPARDVLASLGNYLVDRVQAARAG